MAVNVCDPDRPTPDTFIVRVPLFTLDAVVAVVAVAALPLILIGAVPDKFEVRWAMVALR